MSPGVHNISCAISVFNSLQAPDGTSCNNISPEVIKCSGIQICGGEYILSGPWKQFGFLFEIITLWTKEDQGGTKSSYAKFM